MKIQFPAVAGMFYPAQPGVLSADIDSMLQEAINTPDYPPKALIAPHAGYIYSGPVAASAYSSLAQVADKIKRAVVLAPSHRVAFSGIAASSADYFRTPLGDIAVDQEAVAQTTQLNHVKVLDEVFNGEHALEVQLPFLQKMLSDFMLVPFVVGDARPREVAELLEQLWGGPETLIVISSDLSHYLSYKSAQKRDMATTEAITTLSPELLDYEDACGRIPVSGLLLAAQHHHLKAENIDLRNSGDTAGSKDRVVGYGAYVFH